MTTTRAVGITRFLASPSKVAQRLEWRKRVCSLLALHVGEERIDLAIAAHPDISDAATKIQPLPSIPIQRTTRRHNQKVLQAQVLQELSDVASQWQVCGLVVSWPVQKEGWCGASCGKVLHALDQVATDTNLLTTTHMPVCLWDGHHFQLSEEDAWGRVPRYGQPPPTDTHVHVSRDQYQESGMAAADVARDYLRHYWPTRQHDPESFLARPTQYKRQNLLAMAAPAV